MRVQFSMKFYQTLPVKGAFEPALKYFAQVVFILFLNA